MRQILLQNPTAILLQNATVQLQNATNTTKGVGTQQHKSKSICNCSPW